MARIDVEDHDVVFRHPIVCQRVVFGLGEIFTSERPTERQLMLDGLHILDTLGEHFVRRDDVQLRMLGSATKLRPITEIEHTKTELRSVNLLLNDDFINQEILDRGMSKCVNFRI